MPRKAVKKTVAKQPKVVEAPVQQTPGTSFFDYLRFGESYTSLVLGIIVVIISTALLLSFVHNKNSLALNDTVAPEPTKPIAQNNQAYQISTVPSLSPIETGEPTPTVEPTKEVVKPTLVPTKVAEPTKVVEPTKAPVAMKAQEPVVKEGEYVVKAGDTLWSIAEKEYKSGYNWVDIAKANNLTDPSMINAGNKLIIPKVVAKSQTVESKPTVVTNDEQNNSTVAKAPVVTPPSNKITGNTYKIMHGDTLWSIAERAYGDGYKWTDIAKANGYAHPGLIHADNVIKIPRG